MGVENLFLVAVCAISLSWSTSRDRMWANDIYGHIKTSMYVTSLRKPTSLFIETAGRTTLYPWAVSRYPCFPSDAFGLFCIMLSSGELVPVPLADWDQQSVESDVLCSVLCLPRQVVLTVRKQEGCDMKIWYVKQMINDKAVQRVSNNKYNYKDKRRGSFSAGKCL